MIAPGTEPGLWQTARRWPGATCACCGGAAAMPCNH